MHERAGKLAPRSILVDVPKLVTAYYTLEPDPAEPTQKVEFGTSGHRGSSLKKSFNEKHILATTQAICEYRAQQGTSGPLFMGSDTHALSAPAFATALEVLAANHVQVLIPRHLAYTPTPVVSHAILAHNARDKKHRSDGIIITPSHNPPEDGGFKYNPPSGGPAETAATKWIQDRANELLLVGPKWVKRTPYEKALKSGWVFEHDFIGPYVEDLKNVVDIELIRTRGVKLGVDPMGGSSVAVWEPIARAYRIPLEVVNPVVDPTFGFMTCDRDGKIRMDCSSPFAMAGLIGLKDRFDVAFGNDPDADRHGIVARSGGLMNPNHYLSVAIWYLFQNRPGWRKDAAVGKTLVSSGMIDRVASHLGVRLSEVPVGFKWFVDGLMDGSYGFGGEESAGASFLRMNGTVWTTDKDGILLDLLAAEITAKMGSDPAQIYRQLAGKFGDPVYERIDAAASGPQKQVLKKLSPEQVTASELAGERILSKLTRAPGNGAEIGGLKVITENGWFAARPSGTEDVYKIYAESFLGKDHLLKIQKEAQELVSSVFRAAGV